jgi:hypothetical protein
MLVFPVSFLARVFTVMAVSPQRSFQVPDSGHLWPGEAVT